MVVARAAEAFKAWRLVPAPKRGEFVEIDGLRFEVLRADARQAHLFLVNRVPKTVVREFFQDDEQRHPA